MMLGNIVELISKLMASLSMITKANCLCSSISKASVFLDRPLFSYFALRTRGYRLPDTFSKPLPNPSDKSAVSHVSVHPVIERLMPIINLNRFSNGSPVLSGRVLDSRLRGRGFELHRPHCVVVLEQDTFILA